MRTFKRLSDRKEVELGSYVSSIVEQNDDVKIYIGSDSQNVNPTTTIYATVIAFHYGRRGAHVIYSREEKKIVQDRFSRLWDEVVRSIDVALYLRDKLGIEAEFIDLDLNEDPKYQSNTVLRSALGYVQSLGFTPRYKPNSPYSISIADQLCR
jgi:predicted RNase H-related nuclease YkuK (DUF458 family)